MLISRQTTCAGVLALLSLSCGSAPNRGPLKGGDDSPPTTENAASSLVVLFDTWSAAIEAGDFDTVASLYADDATFQTGNNPQKIVGAAQIAASIKSYASAFPDMESFAIAVIARDRWLASVVLSRGTNTGKMMGQEPTGKRTSFRGLQIWRINEAGKIQEAIAYADNLNFLGHIGMWPGQVRPVDEATPPDRLDVVDDGSDPNNSDNTDHKALITRLTNAIASHDADAVAGIYGDDAVLDDVSTVAPVSGREAIRTYWARVFSEFPDLSYADVDVYAVANHVVVTYSFTGTNQGDLARFDAAATGKPVKLISADVVTIRDGAIERHDIFMDGMAVGFVLGLIKF